MSRSAALALCAFFVFLACDEVDGKRCTALGCVNGVRVDFSLRGAGNYVFDVMVDGEKTTCTATLPLAANPPTPCDRSGMRLTLSGSALPADQQSIGGLELDTTTAKSITIRASRDGQPIGESTVAPDYKVGPPPNGPDCDPPGCTFASYAFP